MPPPRKPFSLVSTRSTIYTHQGPAQILSSSKYLLFSSLLFSKMLQSTMILITVSLHLLIVVSIRMHIPYQLMIKALESELRSTSDCYLLCPWACYLRSSCNGFLISFMKIALSNRVNLRIKNCDVYKALSTRLTASNNLINISTIPNRQIHVLLISYSFSFLPCIILHVLNNCLVDEI